MVLNENPTKNLKLRGLKLRGFRLNIFYRPEGYEPPSITEEDRIRDAFAMNTFYYQPENPFFGDHPMGDALMEMDAVDVTTLNLIEVEEEEEEAEYDPLEELEETEDEEFEIPPECENAYPKVVDGKFVKCPQEKEDYKPVCGSNNQTYFNKCVFMTDKCFGDLSLGPCMNFLKFLNWNIRVWNF